MKIGVAGSVGLDHLMTFPGKFTDSLVAGSLEKVSLSFLVDGLDVRRGGCAANIAFGLGVLGLNPILIAAVGKDFADYDAWLTRHGVDTSHALVSTEQHTAHFTVTTDTELNQIASFFPGAMSEARNIELKPIIDKVGKLDILVVSPDDPEAMLRHTEVAIAMGIAVAADPSQQMARMNGEEIKKLIDGATYLFMNEYELALAIQNIGLSHWVQMAPGLKVSMEHSLKSDAPKRKQKWIQLVSVIPLDLASLPGLPGDYRMSGAPNLVQ